MVIKAQVRKKQIIIPTYELFEDDLNPMFDKNLNPYPYTIQNHRSKDKADKVYEAVELENEYLKLILLPTLGGRLYSGLDKRNGQEFLYKNNVIKPRMIGTRGAWFSGGMEFNFPISHSPTTMDHVNFDYFEHEDGSASVIFGSIEQMSYMNWKVELRLYMDKAYIEQKVHLSNPTSVENRYYFWTNTAVEYNASVKLVYPFDWCMNHLDPKYLKWPMYKETDCRNAGEIPFSYETFGKLMKHNFFGFYDIDKNYGLVHYANRKKVKGAKFFSWGNDGNAKAWNRSLTDDDSQYIELQSGPFESQGVYKFLKPHSQLSWNEYWYPISDMKGFKFAEKELAVNYEMKEDEVRFHFAATEKLMGCRIVFTVIGREQESIVDLTPESVASLSFQLESAFREAKFKLDVYCRGMKIMTIGEQEEFSTEYPDHVRFEDSRTVWDETDRQNKLKIAQLDESFGFIERAAALYKQVLAENPNCTLTLNRLGNLYLKQTQLDVAEACFIRSLQFNPRDGKARFYLAAVECRKGNLKRARSLFMDIAADSEYYYPSIVELTKMNIRMGYYREAESLFGEYGAASMTWLAAIAHRKQGQLEMAQMLLSNESTFNEYEVAEYYLLTKSEEAKRKLLEYTAGNENVLLLLALSYLDLKQNEDTETLLSLIENPTMKTLWVQFEINHLLGRSGLLEMKTITLHASLDRVFVNEPGLVNILLKHSDKDDSGVIDYLLGTYYYGVYRKEDALRSFLSAYEQGLRYTVLLHSIGFIYYVQLGETMDAERYFTEDIQINCGQNANSLIYLDRIYAASGEIAKREQLITLMQNFTNKSLVLLSLVDALRSLGRNQEAMAILMNEEFENWEGKELSGPCYRQMIIDLIEKAFESGTIEEIEALIERITDYPITLNYGDSLRTPLSDVNYYKGLLAGKMGNQPLAYKHFKLGYAELTNSELFLTEKSREFSMKCLENIQSSF
jgi:hypothetical protein